MIRENAFTFVGAMETSRVKKYSTALQYFLGIVTIAAIAVPSYYASGVIGYRTVALVLLLAVSVLAMLFDILPVVVTALISALVWNYFFIPPVFTFRISSTEDGLMVLMYFAVAMINIVLTRRIRKFEKDARDKMEKENTIRLYNTLLNSLSHELRTPIATIIGAVDVLGQNENALSREQQRQLISEVEIAGTRLNRQVENLLSMSRLESGFLQLKVDWCDVNELLYEVMKENQMDATNHHLVFQANEKLPLYKIDRGIIQQVLHNVIHNAIQHTPSGTSIELNASVLPRGFRITIEDNGTGFPDDSLDHVFEKFFRLPQARIGGTGLGLSIVKGYVEAHGGTITLANRESGGASFSIEIPAEASQIKINA